jgi:hypothetical protein
MPSQAPKHSDEDVWLTVVNDVVVADYVLSPRDRWAL